VDVSVNTDFKGEWLRNALGVSSALHVVLARRFLDTLLAALPGSGIECLLVVDAEQSDLPQVPGVRIVGGGQSAFDPLDVDDLQVDPAEVACVLFTSGTTGMSKAVEIAWAQLFATCCTGTVYERPGPQVYYLPYGPHHLSGRSALYRAAMTGGHAVVRESFSTSAFWSDVREHGCTWTILYGAPTRFLAALPEQADDLDNPLELVLMCPLMPETDAVKRRYGLRAFSVWGMTETGNPFVVPPEAANSANVGNCGRPSEGVQARLVDPHDRPVPAGEPGELVLRSDKPWMFTTGYQNQPEATAKAWRNGWFHTGDMFRQNDKGEFLYLDRSKDMIRRRGENISSVELEAAVRAFAGVEEAAAIGVPSDMGDEEVLIAVVARAPGAVDPAALLDFMKERVPRFALPRYVRLMSALPKTPATQRVQKKQLRAEGVTPDTWEAPARFRSARGPGS
ncbi:MAG TPA: AMP-binding protein, partial [Ramlibacter sp.]|nr:AMP-binding protein [Ramlibacter sp.]